MSRIAAVALRTLAAATLVLAPFGCGGTGRAVRSHTSASCAMIVEYEGHRYVGSGYGAAPVVGRPLGKVAVPGCADTPSAAGAPGRTIELAEVKGVPPNVAVTERSERRALLIRDDLDYSRLAPTLARLLRPPACEPADEPIELSGQWLGIIGADGRTELDLVPPYDLRLYVDGSSSVRYERAFLDVRVPAATGRPLTRDDIESVLWRGGTLSLVVGCADGTFVAQRVEAHRPT